MALEPGDLALDQIGEVHVVRVEDADEVSLGEGDPVVRVPVDAACLRLPHRPDAVAVRRDDLGRLVRRAVVHNDHVEVGICLAKDRVEALAQRAGPVQDGDDHRDERPGCRLARRVGRCGCSRHSR
jgi:hypothetical protein